MKKIEIAKAIGLADEKYVAEAAPKANPKARFWRKFTLIAACVSIIATSLCLWLFLPYDRGEDLPEEADVNNLPAALRDYEDSEYLDLMYAFYKYDKANRKGGKNNFETYLDGLFDFALNGGVVAEDAMSPVPEAPTAAPEWDGNMSTSDEEVKAENGYVETTDNQVAGVIEADLFKRTKTHIFYLNRQNMDLYVYSIAGEESKLVNQVAIRHGYDDLFLELYSAQIFLSADGKTLTVLGNGIGQRETGSGKEKLSTTILLAFDVSNPEVIVQKAHFAIAGDYLSARLVDGKILLMSKYYVGKVDYADPTTFLPMIDSGNGFEVMAAEDIIFPETLTSKYYTVVTQVDMETLTLEGAAGCLCYSNEHYVSADKIFLTRSYFEAFERNDGEKYIEEARMTEIYALGYGADGFRKLGSIGVEGTVKNQYSLDEYEGILRVVTTTGGTKVYGSAFVSNGKIKYGIGDSYATSKASNAALYCIDLSTWQIVGEVRDFAPDGETVESVRFDGTNAYVCTAVVITFTDPVYFFDLSDMSNITYTDTGVIEGYSSSLVNFGDGFLLGIGFGANRDTLKIEVYYENGDKVESIASYEREAVNFSQDYKSYFIDRERGLVGLMITDWNGKDGETGDRYILLAFDGYKLTEVLDECMNDYGDPSAARATLADDYFYIMENKHFKVVKLYN
ncbi:MAG: beta-propeller domain-containing protein [Clostridia bacterium]|nr:beta-propeller domain-containing protein [Clostridia bacterium]